MEALPLPALGRRGPPGAAEPGEPPRKRVCKLLETFPNEADARLIDCAMELDSKQKLSSGCGPWDTKTKPNSMIFENQGSRGTAQPCPRCIAGESVHHLLWGHGDRKEDVGIKTQTGTLEVSFVTLQNYNANIRGHFNHILGF